MTIEEFKTAKASAENAIFMILDNLEKEYGISIEGVNVDSYNVFSNGQNKDQKMLLSVRIEASL